MCGFAAAAAVGALLGYVAQWSLPVVVLAVFAGVWVFPRAFYGRAAGRALDEAPAAPDSFSALRWHGGLNSDMADIGTKSFDLEQAYETQRAAARGEFNVTSKASPEGRSESTVLLSRRAKITMISAAAALCAIVFAIQYAAGQFNLRTHPHHWYAVHVHIPVTAGQHHVGSA